MLKRTILGVVCAVALVFAQAGVALAQEHATLVLRSGERVTGNLVDMGGTGFTVEVAGKNRHIPTNDVAVIEFTGNRLSASDWSNISGAQVQLRNGQTVKGELYDIGGKSPLKITVNPKDGQREFSSKHITRIVLHRPNNAASATPTTGEMPSGDAITVSAKDQWTPTGISVTRGERLSIRATGEIRLSGDASDRSTVSGSVNRRYAPDAPIPRTFAGVLIGRVGNGQPFAIGNMTTLMMREDGELFLGINDDSLGDNQGAYTVEVTKAGGAVRRR
jgi:hypothetical protein